MTSYPSSAPDWRPPTRGLFVDLWGTLLELPGEGWVDNFEDARFTPGAVDALFRARQAGIELYLLGNIESVSQGHQSLESWTNFVDKLGAALKRHGVPVTRDYFCTDDPEGVEPHTKDSVYLLPNTGAMYHAAQNEGISLRHSVVVGDSSLELVAGWRAGCRVAAVATGLANRDGKFEVEPDIEGANLAGVIREIVSQVSVSA